MLWKTIHTTDSPFRWAKRQAKKTAPVPMSQLAAPLSPSLATAPTTTPTTSTTLELDAAGDSKTRRTMTFSQVTLKGYRAAS